MMVDNEVVIMVYQEVLFESFMFITAIVMLVILIKDKKGKDYNINIVFCCIADMFLMIIIYFFEGILLVVILVFTNFILKKIYDKGIDEINEYELMGINYKDENRQVLLEQYRSNHSKEEVNTIKEKAKNRSKYRMRIVNYYVYISIIPLIYFIIKVLN